MTDTITIPVWLVVGAAVLLILASVRNLAFPAIRSYLRWRRRRVIETINAARRVTIHTIVLGYSSSFMRRLAKQHRGEYVVAGKTKKDEDEN